LTVLDLARRIRELCGSTSPIELVPRPEDDPEVRQPDVTLARTALNWEARVPLDEGLSRTISWFRLIDEFATVGSDLVDAEALV